jgi:hypothetical protein
MFVLIMLFSVIVAFVFATVWALHYVDKLIRKYENEK